MIDNNRKNVLRARILNSESKTTTERIRIFQSLKDSIQKSLHFNELNWQTFKMLFMMRGNEGMELELYMPNEEIFKKEFVTENLDICDIDLYVKQKTEKRFFNKLISIQDIENIYNQIHSTLSLLISELDILIQFYKDQLLIVDKVLLESRNKLFLAEFPSIDIGKGEKIFNPKEENKEITQEVALEKLNVNNVFRKVESGELKELSEKFAKELGLVRGEKLSNDSIAIVYKKIVDLGIKTTKGSVGSKLRSLGYKKKLF